MIIGFSPILASTPYGPLGDAPPPIYPATSPTRDAPSACMEPLDRLMNTRLAAPCTLSCREGPPLFRVPYPLASPLVVPTGIIHTPNPHLIIGDDSLVSVTCLLNPVEEEYIHTLRLTSLMAQNAPQPPVPVTPQQRPMYIPPWPPVQSGHFPPVPPAPPVPWHQLLCPSHQSHPLRSSTQFPRVHHLQRHPNLSAMAIPQVGGH